MRYSFIYSDNETANITVTAVAYNRIKYQKKNIEGFYLRHSLRRGATVVVVAFRNTSL